MQLLVSRSDTLATDSAHPSQHSGQEEARAYIRTVWEGWKRAQICIVDELAQITMQQTVLEQLKKGSRKTRNHDLANSIGIAIRGLDHKETILRTVANSMLWTMFPVPQMDSPGALGWGTTSASYLH